MGWKEHKARLLQDPEFTAEYEALEPRYQLARLIIKARIDSHLSQQELAKRMGTQQPVVSRLENVSGDPSFSTVKRLADALDQAIVITFSPSQEAELAAQEHSTE